MHILNLPNSSVFQFHIETKAIIYFVYIGVLELIRCAVCADRRGVLLSSIKSAGVSVCGQAGTAINV